MTAAGNLPGHDGQWDQRPQFNRPSLSKAREPSSELLSCPRVGYQESACWTCGKCSYCSDIEEA